MHVIFKTHLDIGFTDLAVNVKKTYFEHFIPKVLTLRERIAEEGREERNKWSAGSWLVYAIRNRRRRRTGGEWSAPLRRPTSCGMDCLSRRTHGTVGQLVISAGGGLFGAAGPALWARNHRRQDDGCSRSLPAIVPIMAQQGIELLHIGVNEASAMPDMFRRCLCGRVSRGRNSW